MPRVRFSAVGHAALGALAWMSHERHFLTVIAKVGYVATPDGWQATPAPLAMGDAWSATATELIDTNDLAPFLPEAEVLVSGALESTHDRARFSVFAADGSELVTKTARRAAEQGGSRIPLTYGASAGGPESPWNPVGSSSPALVNDAIADLPAATGPMPPGWPMRGGTLRPIDAPGLRTTPIDLEPGFRWTFFQTAPADQRVTGYFSGDEILELEGFAPSPRIRCSLPRIQVFTRHLLRDGGLGADITMAADRLRISADPLSFSLTYRGLVTVRRPDEEIWLHVETRDACEAAAAAPLRPAPVFGPRPPELERAYHPPQSIPVLTPLSAVPAAPAPVPPPRLSAPPVQLGNGLGAELLVAFLDGMKERDLSR
ncbi:MAG: DUF2169 domain-containing protein [Polyangiaceae bacterium]